MTRFAPSPAHELRVSVSSGMPAPLAWMNGDWLAGDKAVALREGKEVYRRRTVSVITFLYLHADVEAE